MYALSSDMDLWSRGSRQKTWSGVQTQEAAPTACEIVAACRSSSGPGDSFSRSSQSSACKGIWAARQLRIRLSMSSTGRWVPMKTSSRTAGRGCSRSGEIDAPSAAKQCVVPFLDNNAVKSTASSKLRKFRTPYTLFIVCVHYDNTFTPVAFTTFGGVGQAWINSRVLPHYAASRTLARAGGGSGASTATLPAPAPPVAAVPDLSPTLPPQ
eukprot:scaffold19930_cov115-Isochrysis_galbana.AAC.1